MPTTQKHTLTIIQKDDRGGIVMKRLIVLLLILFCFRSVYSQDLIKEIQKLTLANDSLQKQVIRPLKDSILRSTITNASAMSKLQKQINTLEKDKSELNKKIKDLDKVNTELNKIPIKIERDSLLKRVDHLIANVAELNQKNQDQVRLLAEEKLICEQKTKAEKEKGKSEILASLVNAYINKKFDDLIKASTILSVQRDMQIVGSNPEVKPILSELEKYFNVEKLLSEKYDAAQIRNALIQMNQINQKSIFLDKLKDNINNYKIFNDELIKTIEILIDLDKRKVADSDEKIQKMKLNEILTGLTNYMYNYYDHGNYPYLSDIILEIIKRKQPNADEDITDLLRKLQ